MSVTEVYSHAKQFVLENYTTKTSDMKRIIADMDIVIISNLKMIEKFGKLQKTVSSLFMFVADLEEARTVNMCHLLTLELPTFNCI